MNIYNQNTDKFCFIFNQYIEEGYRFTDPDCCNDEITHKKAILSLKLSKQNKIRT